MARKKNYGYKPKQEYYVTVLYEDTGKEGQLITFAYENGRCRMDHCYWGTDLDYEYSRDGEVEHIYIWDEENTQKLMLRTGTKNGKDLVKAIYERFHQHKYNADNYIKQWCENKGINYDFFVWY